MKKQIVVRKVGALLGLLILFLFVVGVQQSYAVPSTNNVVPQKVLWYAFPCSLPNDQVVPAFPTARDVLLDTLALYGGGNQIATKSRLDNPAGIEIKNEFDAGDVFVLQSGMTNHIWRGILDPTNSAYAGQLGNWVYCPIIAIGNNGTKLALNGLSYAVSDSAGVFGNKSSLATNSYSVSRLGIIADSTGNIFGNGAKILGLAADTNTYAGTNLVDAIVFIGARIGVAVDGQDGINDFNDYLSGKNGVDTVDFVYTYSWGTNSSIYSKDIEVYPQGSLVYPSPSTQVEYFRTPVGILISLVQPETNTYPIVWSSRKVTGPWSQVATNTATGFSFAWTFTNNGTNDTGFVKFKKFE
jgi:hypothetical protein